MKSDRVSAQIDNFFPDCLTLELESQHIEALKASLYLTISFYEQEVSILGGQVKFGLKAVELQLNFENAQMKLKDRMLGAPLTITSSTEVTKELSSEFQGGGGISLSEKVFLPNASLSVKTGDKSIEKVVAISHKIHTKGKSTSPSWDFTETVNDTPLKGLLRDVQIGIVSINQKGVWNVRVKMPFLMRDIHVRGSGGLWDENLTRNKFAVIERLIAKTLVKEKLVSTMGNGELIVSRGELVARCSK